MVPKYIYTMYLYYRSNIFSWNKYTYSSQVLYHNYFICFFQNLEIANLKQKLIDVTKRRTANKDLSTVNNKTSEPSTSTTLIGTADAIQKLHAVIDTSK